MDYLQLPSPARPQTVLMSLRLALEVTLPFLLMLTVLPSAYAEANGGNMQTAMNGLPPIRMATVVFVSPKSTSRAALTESQLRQTGCTYYSIDESKIAALLNILSHAEIRQVAPHGWNFSKRVGVFLTLEGDEEAKLLFGAQYPNVSTVDGEITLPSLPKPQSITAISTLHRSLYEWAATADESEEKKVTNRLPRGCELLIEHMRHP